MEYTKKKQRRNLFPATPPLTLPTALHKGSTTYYGKGFLQGKKYDEVGKYYPKKGDTIAIDSRHKFQTTESLFYSNLPTKPAKNLHYTTSTNFAARRPYDNGPFT
jgi:hypothetical protein